MSIEYGQDLRTLAEARGEPVYRRSQVYRALVVGRYLDLALISARAKNSKSDKERGFVIMSDVAEAYQRANEAIDSARKAYDATVQNFRATIKNDLASISASADRVQKEVAKQMQSYRGVIEMMSSENMLLAIQNAERLATALKAISELESHKITFSVMEKQ